MALTLMQILIESEHTLGWVPTTTITGVSLIKARARMHSIMTKALAKNDYAVADLELALRYCQRRRQPITTPTELLACIRDARELAAAPPDDDELARQIADAIVVEQRRADNDTTYWIGRLVNSQGAGRLRTLAEWAITRGQ